MTKLIIIANDQLVCQGLCMRLSLEKNLEIIGTSSIKKDFLDHLKSFSPDIVILDIKTLDKDGLSLIRSIHDLTPRIVILVLILYDNNSDHKEAIKAGASKVIEKQASVKSLLDIIRDITKEK